MKKIKKVLFGYDKNQVDELVDSYEKIIETNEKDILYLQSRIKNLEKQKKQKDKSQKAEIEIDESLTCEISATLTND